MGIGWRLKGWRRDFWFLHLRSIGSTNEQAALWGRRSMREGFVLSAQTQTRGRGRLGRRWISYSGNIQSSMILRPCRAVADYPQVSFLAALALLQALRDLRPCHRRYPLLSCKWPNDVLLGHKKVAGILLERVGVFLVMGIGVNVYRAPRFMAATSLYQHGFRLSCDALLWHFCVGFWRRYRRWQNGEVTGESLYREWLGHAYGLGKWVTVRQPHRQDRGRFIGLASDGRMRLLAADGHEHVIAAGDILQ